MRNLYFFILFLIWFVNPVKGNVQGDFKLPEGIDKDKISFQLVNSVVVIPVEVNGVTLSFLLDTGVNNTILFSFDELDHLELSNISKITLHGLGVGSSVEALKSVGNTIKIGKATNKNQNLLIVLDEDINFSTRMGVVIHGIIGYDFFKNFVVETNYIKKKIKFYKPESYSYKFCKKCEDFDLVFFKNKPHLSIDIETLLGSKTVNMLLDSGSGDALWLFESAKDSIKVPVENFEDYLGLGLSGNIFGKRARIKSTRVGKFHLKGIKAAFPYMEAIDKRLIFSERHGSIGGELLKRFRTIINYSEQKLRLRPNKYLNNPFHYNMTGIVLEHEGFEIFREKEVYEGKMDVLKNDTQGVIKIELNNRYVYKLAPKIVIAEIRVNSPASQAGLLKGDVIESINGISFHRKKLSEFNNLFYQNEGKKLKFRIKRKGKSLKFTVELKRML